MKILVCIKGVPDIQPPLTIDPTCSWVRESDILEYRMNRYDEYAMEAAIRIKEAHDHVVVDAVTAGPDPVRRVIRRAMALGADNGIYLADETCGFVDARSTASRIGAYAAVQAYDLIFTGVMAEDDMQSLVGPALAARLNIPCATAVTDLDLSTDRTHITVTCEMESGLSEILKVRLPALLTVQSGINRPRYPSLSNMLRARGQALVTPAHTDSAPTAACLHVRRITYPPKSDRCTFLKGTPEQKAETLIGLLTEKSLLKSAGRTP